MDARTVRSRRALREALLSLIKEKEFDEVTIKEVTARAGVSYPVFFRQFKTKEELLSDIAAEEIRQLLKPALDDNEREGSEYVCRYVQERRQLWKTLLTSGAAATMRTEFIRVSKEIVAERGRRNPRVPMDLASAVVVSGIFEVLAWWLVQADDYPISEVARLMDELVFRSLLVPG